MKIKWSLLIGSIILCHIPGIVGGIVTMMNIGWYETLQKPLFTPPGFLISIIWLTLYTLMGISLYLVLIKTKSNEKAKKPLKIANSYFATQLFLNAFWSIAFFGLHMIAFSFFVIILLIVFSSVWMLLYASVDKRVYWFLTPYIIWLLIAAALNYSIMFLNPGLL